MNNYQKPTATVLSLESGLEPLSLENPSQDVGEW